MLARNPKMSSSPLAHVRMVAVSATIPNIEDLAEWLRVPAEGIKRFGEEMRPVKLTTKVFGYAPAKNDFLFEQRLENFIFDILMQYSRGKSALVFCSTRKGAQTAAQRICQSAIALGYSNPFIKSHEQLERLKSAALSFSDKHMQTCIPYGVGYHNGGLCQKDRTLIEGLFLDGDLQILCTTNTLAHGINLPAHTVVIKSTQYYNKEKGLYLEYDRSTVLQMCGRAGRPPFDDTGMVIIMTRRETVHLYENLLNGCEMVESQLHSCMTEHLNAEIVQLSVSDISLAIEWLKCSYLYVRLRKNPEHYGVKKGIPFEQLEKHMKDLCVQQVNELSKYGMVWTDEYGFLLKPLEPGKLMTKYYLKFGTMKQILLTSGKCSLEELLHVICRSEEISWIQLRRNEKKLLNDINADKDGRLRFHILSENAKRKKRIQSREEKIFVLINDCLTGDPMIHDLSLNQDVNAICSSGTRVAKCMKECFIFRKEYKGAIHASILARCLHHRLWDNSQYLLKQLVGIGLVTAKALHSVGIHSFDSLEGADPRRIEIVTGRKYPFGNQIKEALLSIPPKVEMKVEETETRRQGEAKLCITLRRISSLSDSPARCFGDLVVGSEEDNQIFYHERIRLNGYSSPYTVTILITFPQNDKLTVTAHLISEEYVGRDVHERLVVARSKRSNLNKKKTKDLASAYSLPEEIYVVEDHTDSHRLPPAEETDATNQLNNVASSMPSFELLQADEGDESVIIATDEDAALGEIKKPVDESFKYEGIFEHIRKKARTFLPLETFLTMTRERNKKHQIVARDMNQVLAISNSDENERESIIISDTDSGPAEDLSYVPSHDTNDTEGNSYNRRDASSFNQQSNSGDALPGGGEPISAQMGRGCPRQPVKENVELRQLCSKNGIQATERAFPAEENSENLVEKLEILTGEIMEKKDVCEPRDEKKDVCEPRDEKKDVCEARDEQPCSDPARSVFDVSFLGCRSIFSFL
ncbi:unnamed protein product [Victoria cruziana]